MSEAAAVELQHPKSKQEAKQLAIATPVPATPMALMEMAVRSGAGIEVIERLKALYDQERDKREEAEFNAAMNRVQAALVPIAPDLNNPQTKSKYASYAAIDKVLRPIYSREGFSLSFNTEESKFPEHIRVVCFVSHSGGYTRRYQVDMPADGKGAKGGDVMTKTHATGSAMSYGKRYLANFVFNLAIGGDDDGNAAAAWEPLAAAIEEVKSACNLEVLTEIYTRWFKQGLQEKAFDAMKILCKAKDDRRAALLKDEPAQ
ncbi:MAG TPA: ERF family protein [Candidatus Acidoferrales bacterium]|nr:ERF family protein [Candidatus Acidoferrales bacterium]